MDWSAEALKQVNLVEFLSRHYGLKFQRRGTAFACCSPLSGESRPSFFVRLVDGRWLFKDFSAETGGTIFDFVRMKENLGSFAEALAFVRKLLSGAIFFQAEQGGDDGAASETLEAADRGYDVEALYERFRQEDPGVCRRYLLERGIQPDLVEELIQDGTVVHNRHQGRSYCTFAVRDKTGRLKCLDNCIA